MAVLPNVLHVLIIRSYKHKAMRLECKPLWSVPHKRERRMDLYLYLYIVPDDFVLFGVLATCDFQ